MVNIFGDRGKGTQGLRGVPGSVGPTGDRGPSGKSGIAGVGGIADACRWIPKLVLKEFQKDEICRFTHADSSKHLQVGVGGAYTTWISHSNVKKNAVAVQPSKHILHISEKHNALVFENSLYKVDGAIISPLPYTSPHNYTCVCVTFQVEGENDQFIFAD